jgi:hypothetical protein
VSSRALSRSHMMARPPSVHLARVLWCQALCLRNLLQHH